METSPEAANDNITINDSVVLNETVAEIPAQSAAVFSMISQNIQQITGLVLGLGTLLSVAGYIIVQNYLATFSQIQPTVLPAQYLAAGAGFLFIAASIVTIVWLALNFSKGKNFIIFLIFMLSLLFLSQHFSGVGSPFATNVVDFSTNLLYFGLIILLGQWLGKLLYSLLPSRAKNFIASRNTAKEQKPRKLLSMANFSLFVLMLTCTVIGSIMYNASIYGNLPRYLGGGAFSTVYFVLKNPEEWQSLTNNIIDPNNLSETVVVCLIAETEDVYIVGRKVNIDPLIFFTFTIPRSSVLSLVDVPINRSYCETTSPIATTSPQSP